MSEENDGEKRLTERKMWGVMKIEGEGTKRINILRD